MNRSRDRTIAAALIFAASWAMTGCAAGEISKEDFVSEANQICADGMAEFAEPPSDQPVGEWYIATVIPNIRDQVEQIRALGFPAGDEAALEAMLDDTEAALAGIEEAGPALVGAGPDPFADVNSRLVEYGLTVCGADGPE